MTKKDEKYKKAIERSQNIADILMIAVEKEMKTATSEEIIGLTNLKEIEIYSKLTIANKKALYGVEVEKQEKQQMIIEFKEV